MREISTEKIKVGEHVLVDGVEYVAEEHDSNCSECAFQNSEVCSSIPCTGVIFKKVEEEPQYRPYKDTEEMIADYKERFNVSNVPAFCMPLIWIKTKDGIVVFRRLISSFTDACVSFDSDIFMSVRELFDRYTYLDGSPCGKEME